MEDPAANSKLDKTNQCLENDSEPILDTRFQSFLRFYIFDLNNADPCDELNTNHVKNPANKSFIRINGLYVSKVSICGIIVNIYESVKYYRLKIDDSTGCINVTLWKDLIFNEDSLNLSVASSSNYVQSQFSEIYANISSIQSRIRESLINNLIQYEPKQGDLVLIRAHARSYKQRIELNAVSCVRVKNSSEELVQMILPSILFDKVYSKKPVTFDEFENLSKKIKITECQRQNVADNNVKNDNLLNFVLKKLIQMSKSNILDQSHKNENNSSESCESFKLYRFLKSNCPSEFKCLDHKQVLEALKELESRGLVYSCEDEYHYLPLI